MYKVIRYFTDLQDKEYAYQVGDTYPREGLSPTDERIAELSSSQNRQGTPLIEAAEETADEIEAPEDKQETKPRKRKHKGNE
ncbi:MAG: hypothetical protein J6A30_09675 [Ruminococcus sp.]|nr:hypothetical protein [Ruminococcus sp.]